jgi:hypothetical protein
VLPFLVQKVTAPTGNVIGAFRPPQEAEFTVQARVGVSETIDVEFGTGQSQDPLQAKGSLGEAIRPVAVTIARNLVQHLDHHLSRCDLLLQRVGLPVPGRVRPRFDILDDRRHTPELYRESDQFLEFAVGSLLIGHGLQTTRGGIDLVSHLIEERVQGSWRLGVRNCRGRALRSTRYLAPESSDAFCQALETRAPYNGPLARVVCPCLLLIGRLRWPNPQWDAIHRDDRADLSGELSVLQRLPQWLDDLGLIVFTTNAFLKR